MRTTTRRLAALGVAALFAASGLAAAPASAMSGTNPLSAVLTAQTGFDKNGKDFDIVTAAVLAVLKAKPESPVKVLTDGMTPVTAFIPTDRAFMNLVKSLTGKMPKSEQAKIGRAHV